MTIDEAFEILRFDDSDLIDSAGPAVLRLKLMEVASLVQRRLPEDEILQAAKAASAELRRLIAERPCVSLVDVRAREIVLESQASSWERATVH